MKIGVRAAMLTFGVMVLRASTHAQTLATPTSLDVYDGFETPQLSKLWETSRLEPGSIVMQTQIVREGGQAIALSVHPNDKFEAGQHGSADSERDELLEARKLTSIEGKPYEFSFSMFFPQDFPIVPVRLVIAQWKQYCGDDALPCSDDSPVLALRYIGGVLKITQDIGHKTITLFKEKSELRGRWLDFKVQARFTPDATGHVKVWLNNRQIVDHEGVTANAENQTTGYKNAGHFYFKMGLYRNVMPQPMTVYIDEYRKRDLLDTSF